MPEEHKNMHDPDLDEWLDMIARDIAANRNIADIPEALATAMRRALNETSVALAELLDGEVAI